MAVLTYELDNELEKLLMKNGMEEKVRGIVRNVLKNARDSLSGTIKGSIANDPRQAYRAVKHSVYKRILGGNISILNKRRRSGQSYPLPAVKHKLETETNSKGNHRGGNRMPRSQRTEDLMTYYGSDRGFILRFLNSGTPGRTTNGVRRVGNIEPRNFFMPNAQNVMSKAMDELARLINEEIEKAQWQKAY